MIRSRLMFAFGLFLAVLLMACQVRPRGFVDAITPESVSVGVTAPNLINGPIASTKAGQSRRDSLGQVGVSLSATYRLKPIRIERDHVQPVAIVSPTPYPRGEGEAP